MVFARQAGYRTPAIERAKSRYTRPVPRDCVKHSFETMSPLRNNLRCQHIGVLFGEGPAAARYGGIRILSTERECDGQN